MLMLSYGGQTFEPKYEHLRAHPVCISCGEHKSEGLVLCWPCHHKLKHKYHGTYGTKMQARIDAKEIELENRSAYHAA